jgi:Fe-S oxidoreductase
MWTENFTAREAAVAEPRDAVLGGRAICTRSRYPTGRPDGPVTARGGPARVARLTGTRNVGMRPDHVACPAATAPWPTLSWFDADFLVPARGAVRTSTPSPYRQWLGQKLGAWHDRCGGSGCVDCGRCTVCCPVGITITEETEEMAALAAMGEVP